MSHQERSAEVVAKREALQEMLQGAGWQYFLAYARQEWKNEGFRNRMGTALASRDPLDPQVVYKTALEIERLLEWPKTTVLTLKGSTDDE